jgi:uncharacterized membrane protein YfhO
MVYSWEVYNNDKAVLKRLLDTEFPISEKTILEEEPLVKQTKGGINKVDYVNYNPNETVIDVQTDTPGLLFVSDTFYPGWKAYIDDKEEKIFRANYAFRAVEVPGGKHTVRFVYKPESFYKGLKISSATFVVLILLLGLDIQSLARPKK